jgi:hypothetical protein
MMPNFTIDLTPASRCSAAAGHRARSTHWGGMAPSWFVGGVAASLLPRPEDLID